MLSFMSADKLRAESAMKLALPVAEILRVAHEHGATSYPLHEEAYFSRLV